MKLKKNFHMLLLTASLFAWSCREEADVTAETTPVISGLEAEYFLRTGERFTFSPEIENKVESVEWLLNGQIVANTAEYTFEAPNEPGTFHLIIKVYNSGNIVQKAITVTTGRFTMLTTTTHTLLPVEASAKFAGVTTIKWEVLSAPSDKYRLSYAGTKTPVFNAVERGSYRLLASSGELTDTVIVTVRPNPQGQSPYIAKVFDFLPAPGQFVNELPRYEEGDTQEDMNRKAAGYLVGESGGVLSLGGWGGYVVFGFDHSIVNVPGRRDFRIHGNAFAANANPSPNAPFGGSCEPGIIMVACDKNKNGVPDNEEWYEIKGSGNFSASSEPWFQTAADTITYRDYEMTYYRPEKETEENPSGFVSVANYIRWTNNKGQTGYKVKNTYQSQSYYPAWVKENQLTYAGIRLAPNVIDERETKNGSYFVLYAFRYGYVDNYPNLHDNSGIDIDWAIDREGNKADLPGIDFVKVYNGVDQENGWLGEASTEVGRGEDLHLLGINIETIHY
jgi:hypothetical protein